MTLPDYDRVCMPALDFIRALNERPWIVKMLFRLVVGRYAYREFLFMVQIMKDQDLDPFYEYGLQQNEYQSDQQHWNWWKA